MTCSASIYCNRNNKGGGDVPKKNEHAFLVSLTQYNVQPRARYYKVIRTGICGVRYNNVWPAESDKMLLPVSLVKFTELKHRDCLVHRSVQETWFAMLTFIYHCFVILVTKLLSRLLVNFSLSDVTFYLHPWSWTASLQTRPLSYFIIMF